MRKKYIIELPENTHWIQWLMEGIEDHHPYIDFKSVEDLTPYTEPDLEQVRKEAKEEGYRIGYNEGREAGVQQGLAGAWEAARRIGSDSRYGLEKMGFKFEPRAVGDDPGWYVVQRYSASECIEKIRLATILEKM